jgi:serine/threonine protein kinase
VLTRFKGGLNIDFGKKFLIIVAMMDNEDANDVMDGGKLFDEGMYGCIFTPPLKCKDAKKQYDESDTSLSKLIIKEYANKEWLIMAKIKKIPLWKNYFIVSESSPCVPAPIQKEKELALCPPLTNSNSKLSDFRILTMPYGGTPLTSYRVQLANFDFMGFVTHFIEAGALLNLFGIVHRDIHQGNILVDNEQVPRIIDYNLSILVESIVTLGELKHKYEPNLAQEPPDSTLVNAVHQGYNYEKVINSIINKKQILKKVRIMLGISAQEQLESLEDWYRMSKAAKSGDEVAWFNNYWRTIDSWAIGVNIVDFISKLSLWPEFSTTLNKVRGKLFPVLRRMCEVNPKQRIDCVQALNMLSPNSFIIRKYSKEWLAKVGDT